MRKTGEPIVSVVIPVYNTEMWLEECLDSIIRQTLREIEIICVNDGSTDRSSEILRTYAEADSRIRIICQENKGLSEARNTGVRTASGEYLYFMDSDDTLEPDALEICAKDMTRRDLEYLCFNMAAFGNDPETARFAGEMNHRYFKRILDSEKIYTGQELFTELEQQKSFIAPVQSCVLRRNVLLEHDLWFHKGILHEDEPWMFTVLMSVLRCGCLNRFLYRYRIRSNSITQGTVSFANAYGRFAGFLDAELFLRNHPQLLQNEQFKDIEMEHVLKLQRAAVRTYIKCNEKERQKRKNLSPEERMLFEQLVVYPSSLKEITIQQEQNNSEIKKKYADLQKRKSVSDKKQKNISKDNTELKKAAEKDRKKSRKVEEEIKQIKSSPAYRLGRLITFVPGKVKCIFRKAARTGSPKKTAAKGSDSVSGRRTIENTMVIFPSEVTGNRIVFQYSISGKWSSCFRKEETFEITYPFDMESIPESIRIIPFLSQVLPVSWIWDAEIKAPVCDRDFYDCIEKVKDGYKEMFPMLPFNGELKAEHIEENKKPEDGEKALVCFSGGVDATSTTLSHLAEKPLLVGLWGADVPWENEDGWSKLESLLQWNADALNLEMMTVHSSFRKLLNEKILNKRVLDSGDNWYHGFQHGIGLLGHIAPAAWHERIGTVYIASSNTEGTVYTCASDPSIDNFVRFCGTKVVHDGYETDRQEKIQRIADFCRQSGLQLPFHVCWEKRDGDNCCHCEKCWRTMLGLYAAGEDPKQYGFPLFTGFGSLSDDMERDFHRFRVLTVANYQPVQKKLQKRAAEGDLPQELSWFADADLSHIEDGSLRLYRGKLVRPLWLLGTPDHNNLGDYCILEGEKAFLHTLFPDRTVIEVSVLELKRRKYSQLKEITFEHPVFLEGGGDIGTIWPLPAENRLKMMKLLQDKPMIIFPQSIWFSEDEEGRKALAEATEIYKGDNILLCCRDSASYRFAQEHFECRSILVPDMALWESRQGMISRERFGALTLLRSDKERKLGDDDQAEIESYLTGRFRSVETFDTVLHSGKVTRENRTEKIDDLVQRISSVECVVTDRLHGMILCAVTGTPCVVFGNGYHKIEAFYEWLKDLKYIRFIHRTDELPGAIDEVCSCAERIYPEKEMRERFSELIRSITGL